MESEWRQALPGDDQGERDGAGASPVAALGIIGQVASHLPINMEKINSS